MQTHSQLEKLSECGQTKSMPVPSFASAISWSPEWRSLKHCVEQDCTWILNQKTSRGMAKTVNGKMSMSLMFKLARRPGHE